VDSFKSLNIPPTAPTSAGVRDFGRVKGGTFVDA
jgi:hypothetical protein